MIVITGINRHVDMDKGGEASDTNCMTFIVAGNDTNYNKARFRLTAEETAEFEALARKIENRIGESVLSDVYVPPPAPETPAAQSE